MRNMDKLFFNGEFTNEGNIRGEDVYQFLDNLKVKMEANEVAESCKVDFFKRHLSVSAKTIVGSVKDFDEAASKLIKVYGNKMLIITRMTVEANMEIRPLWRRVKWRTFKDRLAENILALQSLTTLLDSLVEMSKRSDEFHKCIFHIDTLRQIYCLVPRKAHRDFAYRRVDKGLKDLVYWRDPERYLMEFKEFIQEELLRASNVIGGLIPNTDELKNDIVKQSEREANEETDEDLEDSVSDNESSCMEEDADEVENATDENVQETEDFDKKLLKDKEKFA